MNVVFKIALRYLLGKKSHTIVNLVSLVSIAGVFTGAMALIIVLSVFNGFGSLVLSLYNTFDPDIKVSLVKGKTFDVSDLKLDDLKSIKGVAYAAYTLEENCLARYGDKQYIVTLKGMNNELIERSGIGNTIISGSAQLQAGSRHFAIVGSGIAYALSLHTDPGMMPIELYLPDKNATTMVNPEQAFRQQNIAAGGIFSIQQDFDSKYILAPLEFVQSLTGEHSHVSSVEIFLAAHADEQKVAEAISNKVGNNFKVMDRGAQHAFLYQILKSEKLAVFLILCFIMVIGVFNILGTLTMLVIEKKHDILILKYMGCDFTMVRNIFFLEGVLITFAGVAGGLLAGGLICWLQQTFHWIKLGHADSFVVDAYPVQMMVTDFIGVFAVVFFAGSLASWLIASQLAKKHYHTTQQTL